ncbi:MAG: hypothetical protein Q9187_003197 [Circinaria calcarea]
MPGVPHAEPRGSQLYRVSTGNTDETSSIAEVTGATSEAGTDEHGRLDHQKLAEGESFPASLVCSLGVHDEGFSKEDALLDVSLFPEGTVNVGDYIRIVACDTDSLLHGTWRPEIGRQQATNSHGSSGSIRHDHFQRFRKLRSGLDKPGSKLVGDRSYVYVVKKSCVGLNSRQPTIEVCIAKRIADALGFKQRSPVTVTKVDKDAYSASHVELAFRDAYLTRADMWRLVVSELADKSVYKGQRLHFMGTRKAQIKAIYIHGQKVPSAFFGPSTKPIFRSESARYVLYIQMSKEMWDFDTDGTGEIMFHKVINGFLPELFKRWEDLDARHLVSVILFTRLEYDRPLTTGTEGQEADARDGDAATNPQALPFKDFYRVLIIDMSSREWAAILTELKREFRVFLRDVSIRTTTPTDASPLRAAAEYVLSSTVASEVIDGRPAAASRGNILEAINLASSQFSGDYIDRDLVRTGLAIIIISPGTGVFEVDQNMLSMTSDTLIENGIGIDLVCLSRMPLHSVPLLKYQKTKSSKQLPSQPASQLNTLLDSDSAKWNFEKRSPLSESSIPDDSATLHQSGNRAGSKTTWHYGIPHWIDVSFWTAPSFNGSNSSSKKGTLNLASSLTASKRKVFLPRVRMYELQMMGVMENEMSNISIPYIDQPSSKRVSTSNDPKSAKHLGDFSVSPSSENMNTHCDLLHWMDDHDAMLFRHPLHRKATKKVSKVPLSAKKPAQLTPDWDKDAPTRNMSPSMGSGSMTVAERSVYLNSSTRDQHQRHGVPDHKPSTGSVGRGDRKPPIRNTNLSRQISFGLRGFGGTAPKSVPVIEVSTENAQYASLLTRGLRAQPASLGSQSAVTLGLNKNADARPSSDAIPINNGKPTLETSHTLDNFHSAQPITIRPGNQTISMPDGLHRLDKPECEKFTDSLQELPEANVALESQQNPITLSSSSAMAPWLTVLNPSNPRKVWANENSRLGRWHHVFPRPMRASNIKWKSLCAPASMPLTTEDSPTADQLAAQYEEISYTVSAAKEDSLAEEVKTDQWLMRELISARLSQGFQIVVGRQASPSDDKFSVFELGIFNDNLIGRVGIRILMSKGNTIHQLSLINEGIVEVKQHLRRSVVTSSQEDSLILYKPAIRTVLNRTYVTRTFAISSPHEVYDWHRLDTFIASHEEQKLEQYPDSLRFWRARFVLIPVDHPSNSKRPLQSANEDNEEEIRLEGIRKLTQLWQKHRYIPQTERRFQSSSRKRRDNNPLDIIYQTRNPSAIVAAELDSTLLIATETNEGKPSQLLPENDLYERTNLNLASLAQAIQSDRGVKLMDRRWHWRLHYNCFIGIEFTTWLLNNFKDVDSREEAVELGNELMESGLFQHVEQRHNFRDGNFFYQIASEFRMPRVESRSGWFGSRRSDQSMPSTPVTEGMRNLATGLHSRASSNGDELPDGDSPTPPGKRRLGVALSKGLTYDVDHRKKSYRNELINLHYDRISSADDCYHLRIHWLNVTPKLIEDSIVSWATSAERFGLRLVELPIGEASRIHEVHPFRSSYRIRLAKYPPERQPQTYFDATSLAPQAVPGQSHSYQKAILKKFNFVLDLEAAKDFPPSVEVTYSWGKPDYHYPQYISREGVLLAQITDDGDFLLLANRLYNNRSAGAKDVGKAGATEPLGRAAGSQRSPARIHGNLHGTSPRVSPFSSPMIRATPDVGLGFARSELVTPEKIANELEAFCKDAEALTKFYEEVLHPTTSSTPGTPAIGDGSIPVLGLPSHLNLRGDSSTDLDALGSLKGPKAKSTSPNAG